MTKKNAVFWQSGLDPPPPWQIFLDPRMQYVPVNNFSLISGRFPAFMS